MKMFFKRQPPALRSLFCAIPRRKNTPRAFRPRIEGLEPRQVLSGTGFLQGTAFYDTNANSKLDADEAYKSGATIFLDLNFNGDLDSGEPQDTTDANGQYFFGGLDAGTYHIVEIAPVGYTSGGTEIRSQFNTASQFSPNTIEVTLVDPDDVYVNFVSYGLSRSLYLDFTDPSTNVTTTEPLGAGQINISLGDDLVSPPAPPDQDLSGPFVSYCLDLSNDLDTADGDQFKVIPKPTDVLANNGGRIAYLYNHFGQATGLTRNQYGGLQLALWELVYDAVPDLTTGNIKNIVRPSFVSVADFNATLAAAQNFIDISAGKSEVAVYLDAESANPGVDQGLQGMIATESYNFANIPTGSPQPQLRIIITPDAVNPVNDPHTFTVTVEKDDGLPASVPGSDGEDGFVAAVGAPVSVTLTNQNDASAIPLSFTGSTDGNGQFSATFSSPTAGVVIGNAYTSFDFDYAGTQFDTTLFRDTDAATPIGNGPGGSGPAIKTYVDAYIVITPDATNEVGDDHTFTATVYADNGDGVDSDNDGSNFDPVGAGEDVTITLTSSNGASAVPDGPLAGVTDATGQFSVTFTSATAGLVVGTATSDVDVGGLVLTRMTDGEASNSGPATKRFVDAYIEIEADGVNRVGDDHEFTVTVYENLGEGAGFVPAGNQLVTFDLSAGDVGFFVGGISSCTTADDGTCTISVNSAITGEAIVVATASIDDLGTEDPIVVSTTGSTELTDPGIKRWVDAKILISPNDVNRVGENHQFTVTVLQNDGLGGPDDYVPVSGVTVDAILGAGSIGSLVNTSCVTVAGSCIIEVSSNIAGIATVIAEATINVDGVEIELVTDGMGGSSNPATKRWVDAQIDVTPLTATNRLNDEHDIIVTVQQDDGLTAAQGGDGVTGWATAPDGTLVTFSLLNNSANASFVGGVNTCITVGGSCVVTINSSTPGGVDIHATTTFLVGGLSVTRATGTGGNNSSDAHKDYVRRSIDVEKTTNGPSNSNEMTPDYDNEDSVGGDGVPVLVPGTAVTWTYKVTNTSDPNTGADLSYLASEIVLVDDNGTPDDSSDDMSIANGLIQLVLSSDVGGDGILSPGEEWLYTASGTVQLLSSGGPGGDPATFNFEGSSPLSGTAGNTIERTVSGITAKANAFSKDGATWAKAYLGAYSGGLGVTDGIEGNGSNDTHTVDNVGLLNFVSFRFSETVIVDQAYLGYVVDDSDLTIWVGNVAGAYDIANFNLSDAILSGLVTELNTTSSSSPRTADFNGGNVAGNVLIIAARTTSGDSYQDRFKIKTVKVDKPEMGGCYENKATLTVDGGDETDSDKSHYCNPETPPPSPGIDIEKTTNGPTNSNPTAPNYDNEDTATGAGVPILTPGTTVTWTYKVTNTGNVPYTTSQIAIVDDNGTPSNAADDMTIANSKITFLSVQSGDADNILEPGEVWLYKATGIVQTLGSTSSGTTVTFDMAGNSSTSGSAGNTRVFSAGGVSVRASAFSRDADGNWDAAYLGSYGGGLGVTDGSEGSGGNNTHTVDNVGRDNYVLFEFSQNVIVDSAFLGYVVDDSDLRIWIGTKTDPFNNHFTLNNSVLASLGFTEVNLTSSSSTRTADFNAGNLVGNVLVIAAQDDDDTPEDRFKIELLKVKSVEAGCYENKAVVTVPGDDDSDKSHYCNPTAPPPPSMGSVSGHKYRDKTGNGASTDDKSYPIAGVTMYADFDNDGYLDSNEPRDVTDNDGYFQITGLVPGSYKIREVVPTGYVRTGPTMNDFHTVTVVAGQNSSVNTSGGKNDFYNFQKCDTTSITQISYKRNGTTTFTDLGGNVYQGDQVTVKFYVTRNDTEASFVSYTAPDPYFDANRASMQEVFDSATGVFDIGWRSLTIDVPDSYFQVDFVCGAVIDVLGPAGSNIFYTPQGRLIDAHNGGTTAPVNNASSIAGVVYVDKDNDGYKDSGEGGIGGVTVKLYKPEGGYITKTTRPDGSYSFSNLKPGSGYEIRETKPSSYNDGKDKVGSLGGSQTYSGSTDVIDYINVGSNVHGTGYNFGERPQWLVAAGTEVADAGNEGLGNVASRELFVSIENVDGLLDENRLSRIRDSISSLNSSLASFGVSLTEVAADSEIDSDIQLRIATDSDCGGLAEGVLGCASGSEVTIIDGWNWYLDSDETAVGVNQYDFQSIVTHELGHGAGLGHSQDASSTMFAELAAGVARRYLTEIDLASIGQESHEDEESEPEALVAISNGNAQRDHRNDRHEGRIATAVASMLRLHDRAMSEPVAASPNVRAESTRRTAMVAIDNRRSNGRGRATTHDAALLDVVSQQSSTAVLKSRLTAVRKSTPANGGEAHKLIASVDAK
jgi:hypothetical protein